MKTVLMPVDDSVNAHHAVEFAVEQVLKLQDKIILLNVRTPVTPPLRDEEHREARYLELENQYITESNAILQKYLDIMQKFEFVEALTVEGNAREVILEQYEIFKPDLIIMGAKDKKNSSLMNFFTGTKSQYIMNNVECSVLLTRNKLTN